MDYIVDAIVKLVKLKNNTITSICPIWDFYCNNWKELVIPVSRDGVTSEFEYIFVHPSNTEIYYYFKYESSYDYNKTMKALNYPKEIITSLGTFDAINLDDDFTINLILNE
jgi:hypothetical protein